MGEVTPLRHHPVSDGSWVQRWPTAIRRWQDRGRCWRVLEETVRHRLSGWSQYSTTFTYFQNKKSVFFNIINGISYDLRVLRHYLSVVFSQRVSLSPESRCPDCGDHSKEWTVWCKPTAKRMTVYGHQESLRSRRYVLKRQLHQSLTIFVSSASLYLIVHLRVLLDTRIFITPAWSPKNQT